MGVEEPAGVLGGREADVGSLEGAVAGPIPEESAEERGLAGLAGAGEDDRGEAAGGPLEGGLEGAVEVGGGGRGRHACNYTFGKYNCTKSS